MLSSIHDSDLIHNFGNRYNKTDLEWFQNLAQDEHMLGIVQVVYIEPQCTTGIYLIAQDTMKSGPRWHLNSKCHNRKKL